MTAALKATDKAFGRLDVAVNCAGIGIAKVIYNIKNDGVHPLDEFNKVVAVWSFLLILPNIRVDVALFSAHISRF